MATTVRRIPASFRFQSTLMDELKRRAKVNNRSLNNYVESLLIGLVYPTTHVSDESLMSKEQFLEQVEKAISKVKSGESYAMMPGESLDAFMDRMKEEGNV